MPFKPTPLKRVLVIFTGSKMSCKLVDAMLFIKYNSSQITTRQKGTNMTTKQKIKILAEFKEEQALKAKAEARIKELKAQIQAEIDQGKYGDYVLIFEERDVKQYVVSARTDTIVKVHNLKAQG
jgi:hypothetical protein